jgi:hypothetical protein
MKRAYLVHTAAAWLALALVGFVALTALAALNYPGGTYCEPQATQYRFWGNFLCDLTAKVTARGQDNARSAAFAEAAFASFSLGLGPFFWLLAELAARRPAIRALGLVSAAATATLAWLPSRSGATLHAVAVFGATLPGLAAVALGVDGLLRRRSRAPPARHVGMLGAATLAAGFADAAGYSYALATHAGCLAWLPALQKIVALLLVVWMLAVATAGSRAASLGGR